MRRWLAAHWRAFSATLARFAGAPLTSLLNVTVIGTALALPLGFYLVLSNLQGLARDYSPQPQVSIFLNIDAQEADVREITQRLKSQPGIAGFRFVPRDQALKSLQSRTGLGDVIAGLGQNPLPDAFVVDAGRKATALESLRAEFARWPKVAEVHVDSDWARRLDSLLALGRYAVLMLASALALALVAITFNTIRLQILTQRDEIEVAKLIGATDGYIQRPFLYLGSLIGCTGGAVAWLMVWGALWVFNGQLRPLAELYGIPLTLAHLNGSDSMATLLFAGGLGWFGAWLSVRRHLHHYNPS
ncbi:MAG: permease-like cell division protein FtsX [Betaproteobacteria bacterium]|nr:permease-like cell division protein FtsX [Betaproteobacteria bacterium]MDH4294453.1 permease-like cell division protein FtsX [Betaproteobacteria bacterium]MDH5342917.1 permease-like cell division protein FtsX [Betaproteobacteria bacterium]